MPILTLTAKGIESLQAREVRADFWDTDVKGLHVRVYDTSDRWSFSGIPQWLRV